MQWSLLLQNDIHFKYLHLSGGEKGRGGGSSGGNYLLLIMQITSIHSFKCKKSRRCSVEQSVSPPGWISSDFRNLLHFIAVQYEKYTTALP